MIWMKWNCIIIYLTINCFSSKVKVNDLALTPTNVKDLTGEYVNGSFTRVRHNEKTIEIQMLRVVVYLTPGTITYMYHMNTFVNHKYLELCACLPKAINRFLNSTSSQNFPKKKKKYMSIIFENKHRYLHFIYSPCPHTILKRSFLETLSDDRWFL